MRSTLKVLSLALTAVAVQAGLSSGNCPTAYTKKSMPSASWSAVTRRMMYADKSLTALAKQAQNAIELAMGSSLPFDLDPNYLNCVDINVSGTTTTVTISATGMDSLAGEFTIIGNDISLGYGGYFFPITSVYYETGINLMYACVDSSTLDLLVDAQGNSLIPAEY